MTDALLDRIDSLTDAQLAEAASSYLTDWLGVASKRQIDERLAAACETLQADPLALEAIQARLAESPDSYRPLFRFLLREGAQGDEEQRQAVADAVEGAGQKQVVVELALAISLASVAIVYLIHKTDGVVSDRTSTTTKTYPDGTVEVTASHEVIKANPVTALGQLFSWVKVGGQGPKAPGATP
jgi:hypothetical protein